MGAAEPEVLVVRDVAAWRAWLDANEYGSDGVWLLLAKKGTSEPTSLTYAQALPEALCSGWIDGQSKSIDDGLYRVRFTPRRKASLWSRRNTGYVEELIAQGRMRARGHAEIERAKADGRWARAYAGSATAEVPADLAAALAGSPAAGAAFEALSKQDRYLVLHRVLTAASDKSRRDRIARLLSQLEEGTLR